MKDIEATISSLVKTQFPEFYNTEGTRFVDFVQQYYVWMESQNQAINRSRNLFNYRDIDKTSQEFVGYFKNKYLNGFPITSAANTQFLTKHAGEIYGSKGTSVGVQLTMRALFNEPASVHYPSEDLFKTSDGIWITPVYLELSVSDRTKLFIGKEIVGSRSGAKAFMEALVKKRVAGKNIQVAYLSDLRGNFVTGDIITTTADTNLEFAPIVIGSMTSLTVEGGGANFAVGDLFDVVSVNGKQGKARVTSINNETGKVNFIYVDALTSGGWGYSIEHANVIVAQKMLEITNTNNANSQITGFAQFEGVTQTFANIGYNTARPNNANYTVGAVVENYYANGNVAANAIIVAASATTGTTGYIIVAPQTGNVASVDTVFAIRGTGATFSFNANSGVANTTEYITTTTAHTFANGDIVVYSVATGNTALAALSDGAAYCIINANTTAFQVADTATGTALNLTAGLNQTGHRFKKSLGSGVITAYNSRSATATVMKSNTEYLGVTDISSNGFIITPYANVVGVISNTTATISNTSTGTGATFNIGLLTDTETVLLSPDFLHSNNTQNVQFSTINLNGNNSGLASNGYGFAKFPNSNINSILLDCLRFDSTTIGSIATLTGRNTGADYNVDPFVTVLDPWVFGYNKRDYVMQINPLTGGFVVGEEIQQTFAQPAIQLTVNNFSGTAANGTATTTVAVTEKVYQSYANGADRAYGFVVEAGISAGSGTIKLANVTGTFVTTSNTTTKMKSLTTGGTANISLVDVTTLATSARAIVKEVANSSFLKLKRINLENTFGIGNTIIGEVSGATATIATFDQDPTVPVVGVNANIYANVQTANAVVKTLSVQDSGFGYLDFETVTLTKEGSDFEVTAIVQLGQQGVGAGYYSSTRGFLDSDKKLHDNDYYQEYSYEVITKIPFDRYIDVLKQVMHVAGTKVFGKVEATSVVNTNATIINSIVIS